MTFESQDQFWGRGSDPVKRVDSTLAKTEIALNVERAVLDLLAIYPGRNVICIKQMEFK